MKKFLILMISVGILSCANNKTEQVSTIKIKDEKAQKISKMMESYVNNNFDSSIISEDAKIKFNQLEMTKTDFENWKKSEAFRKAHSGGGQNQGIYLGHPEFEGFEVIL